MRRDPAARWLAGELRWRRLARVLALVAGVLCSCLANAVRAAEVQFGGIRGSVFDPDFGVALPGVRVTIVETPLSTSTSADGMFVLERVPAGTYTLILSKEGYQRKTIPNVVVTAGSLTEVRAEISAEVVEMEEFVVHGLELGTGTETGLLEIRQQSVALQDAISAELMKRAGATTAASALRLVVGASVQDGKYAVVRGLADRYTTTLLNGVRLPSSDADKRAVQVDQFPAGLIESITVNKTFTPDQQGDSTGGSVNIKTKSIPKERFLTVSGAVEYNTQATGNDRFLTYKGGGTDTFAIDNGRRALPSIAAGDLQGFSAGRADALTRSFYPSIGVTRGTAGPNYSWSVTGGDRVKLGQDSMLGVFGSFSYRQKYEFYEDGQRQSYTQSDALPQPTVQPQARYTDSKGTDEVQWGALGGLGLQINPDNQFTFTLFYGQTAKDEARLLEGKEEIHYDTFDVVRSESLRYTERTLDSYQLRGDHKFEQVLNSKLDWTLALSDSRQNEPDHRFLFTQNDQLGDGQQYIDTADFSTVPRRIWRDIREEDRQAQLNFTVPFRQWDGVEGFFKCGPFWDEAKRNFFQRSFAYQQGFAAMNPFGAPPPLWSEVFLDPGNIGTNSSGQLLWYTIPTGLDVSYTGEQTILAGYGMVELPLAPWFRMTGGARIEQTKLSIDPFFEPWNRPEVLVTNSAGQFAVQRVFDASQITAKIEETDVLPAIGFNWEIVTNLHLRGNWSQTIARPTFRELSPVSTFEFFGDDLFVGNPNLQIARADNYDLRLEWFRRPGDLLSAGVFYKEIQEPIERVRFSDLFRRNFITMINYPNGQIYGVEGEVRQRMDVLHEWLKDFTAGANATLIFSRVEIPPDDIRRLRAKGFTDTTRAMRDQPEYLFNANLVYENQKSGTSVGLFYNVTGKTLVAGPSAPPSAFFSPAVYEEPIDSLDLGIEQKIGKHWALFLRAKNLTDPLVRRFYDVPDGRDITYSSYRKGMDFSLGASCSW